MGQKKIAESTDDPERQAFCYLGLGQLAEQAHQYDAALDYYAKGLALSPTTKEVAYLLHNNTGYCLNLKGRHAEAERYCRLAIEIDSGRANAFKNLGISLAGQNDLVGAAWAYVEATRADSRDPRALHLLERLLEDHPELASQFPGIQTELKGYRKAVETTLDDQSGEINRTYEICRLRYVPGKEFFELKDRVKREISAEEIERLYTAEALTMVGKHPYTWCAVVAEEEENTSQASKEGTDQIPNFRSRSEYLAWCRSLVPALLLRGHASQRLEQN